MPLIDTLVKIGNEPPLIVGGRSKYVDRRDISARWLYGTFLTGVTSSVLMGIALFASLDSRERLVTRPEVSSSLSPKMEVDDQSYDKTDRLIRTRVLTRLSKGRRIDVSTMTKSGDMNVVRMVPVVQMKMSLDTSHPTNRAYPPFDPLTIFTEEEAGQDTLLTGAIYGANVDSVVLMRTVEFPFETADFDETSIRSSEEVEAVVRELAEFVTEGDVEIASLHYVDPERFGTGADSVALKANSNIRILTQNVSDARRSIGGTQSSDYAEDIFTVRSKRNIADIFVEVGYAGVRTDGLAETLAAVLGVETLRAADVVRLGIETRGQAGQVVRASVYRAREHVATVALDDKLQYVRGNEPESNPAVLNAFEASGKHVAEIQGELPTIYDGIYRASLSHGLTQPTTRQLVQLLSANVDFEAAIGPQDKIEVLYSQPDENDSATSNSQLLYIEASVGGTAYRFYRFQMENGTVGYFDDKGRSARRFLLRNPIPTGLFTSGFGNRRHPILGYVRPHTGVDWAAPRGTPIIAPGDGTVDRAGWNGGYGRQTVIRHGNGYRTTFNHQSEIADGVVPGARIRQGQIIGYVGSTGQSTGNHLHYELIINGKKVDPMRARLPSERTLAGAELTTFLTERRRIDSLLRGDRLDAHPSTTSAELILRSFGI